MLTDKEISEIHQIIYSTGTKYTLHAGQTLAVYPSENNINVCYFLDDGICALTRFTSKGDEHIYAYHSAKRLIGFFGFLGIPFKKGKDREIHLITKTKCTVWAVTREDFDRLLENNHLFAKYMLQILAENYSEMNYRMYEEQDLTIPQRICILLIQNAYEKDGKTLVPRYLTYSEISKYLGTHEITVSRIFSSMVELGLIQREGRRTSIPDIDRLNEFYSSGAELKY